MLHVIFGTQKTTIAVNDYCVYCPSCEADRFAAVRTVSKYVHVYFIPVVPLEKEANIICQTCGLERYDVPLRESLFKNYSEIKMELRHPWYTYLLPLALLTCILLALMFH